MSRLRTNIITNRMANGAPTVSNGLVISGVTTTSNIKVGTGITLNVYGGATYSGIVSALSFRGDGSQLTGIDASALKFGGAVKAQASNTGVNITGALTVNNAPISAGLFAGGATGIHSTSTVGVQTADVTSANLVGAATSMVGLYIGDGHLLFSNYLNKSGGYYITTGLNALNAGPVTLGTPMTLDGTWTIV